MASLVFIGGGIATQSICIGDTLANVTLLPYEATLRTPFPSTYPNLELYRRAALTAVCSSQSLPAQGRTLIGFTHTTDTRGVFVSLLGSVYDNAPYNTCSRKKALAVDTFLTTYYTLYPQILTELRQIGTPLPYITLFQTRLLDTTFNNRVAAFCSIVYIAAILIAEAAGISP